MRIRMYHDGATSKLLEKLSEDSDNPTVQLQGPSLIAKLAPPPAHRSVIMIAAGTGVDLSEQNSFGLMDSLVLPSFVSRTTPSARCAHAAPLEPADGNRRILAITTS
ncbi:unnamed protein product [Ectocarpus sp. 8 AP-2014]